jgi:hypothetical protein
MVNRNSEEGHLNGVVAIGIGAILVAVIAYLASVDLGLVGVILIGGGVGAVELLGRYLYAPMRAIFTTSGLVYIFVNMLAAAAAFYIIGPHGFDTFDSQAKPSDPANLAELKTVLLAGFGALAFMRSSIFTVRVGDSAIGIGPAAILDTLLMVADRGVDRREAILRAREVTDLLAGVDPVRGATLLTSYCFALMQNVSKEEQQKIEEAVQKIASAQSYDAEIRLDLIALALSRVVGPTVLEAAIIALGDRLKKQIATAAASPLAGQGATPAAESRGNGPAPPVQPPPIPVSDEDVISSVDRARANQEGQ